LAVADQFGDLTLDSVRGRPIFMEDSADVLNWSRMSGIPISRLADFGAFLRERSDGTVIQITVS
jgi:hypothetical protein